MEKVLESGAVLELSLCSFEEGNRLFKAVAREIKDTPICFGAKGGSVLDFFNLDVNDDTINTIKNIVAGFIASEEIEAALWPCMERGTYTVGEVTHKINRSLFDDEKIRADYVPIMKEALVYSLGPFSGSLRSLAKGLRPLNSSSQK